MLGNHSLPRLPVLPPGSIIARKFFLILHLPDNFQLAYVAGTHWPVLCNYTSKPFSFLFLSFFKSLKVFPSPVMVNVVLSTITYPIALFHQRPFKVLYSALSSAVPNGPISAVSRRTCHRFELDLNMYEHQVTLSNTCVTIHICFGETKILKYRLDMAAFWRPS